jgi:chromosome segregation ATPase
MSDEELIARLNRWIEQQVLVLVDSDLLPIRDRIEALTEQLTATQHDAKEAEAYAEELEREQKGWQEAAVKLMHKLTASEAKLAECEARLRKALEALENVIGEYDLFRKDEYERGLAPLDDEIHEARSTLAEISSEAALNKGESHE